MNDDDIPVLTNVVKRERRAQPPIDAAARQAIGEQVGAAITAQLNQTIDAVILNMAIQLRERVKQDLAGRLPDMVDAAIREQIQKMASDSDSASG